MFSILDLVVDMTGIMDRDRGSYGYMRAGVLGYFQVDTLKGTVSRLKIFTLRMWHSQAMPE